MKTQGRIIAAILSVMMILTALPPATFAQTVELKDDGAQESVYAGVKIDSARIISEDDARRSENEKHFKLDDGTYLAVKYGYPIHTKNEIGEWENIDLSFAASENAGADVYISETDALSAAVADSTTMQLVSAEDMYPVSLTLSGFDMAPAEKQVEEETETDETSIYEENIKAIESAIKSHVLHFADATQDARLTYERTYASVRQSIVIDREIENHSLSFAINTGDLTAVLDDSGGVEIKDGEEVKYTLPAPYMYDSENQKFSLLSYLLEETEDGEYILTISLNDALSNSEEITYPVTVSASVNVPCEKSNYITAVSSDTPDMSYTGENILIGRTGDEKITRAFFDAEDLPALTENDIMLSAQLHTALYYFHTEEMPSALEAHSVFEEWDADSITWNNQPAYFDEAKECTVHETDSEFVPFEWDITKEVLNRYDGEVAYGIAFVSSDETADGAAYMGEVSPYLLVNYVSVSQDLAEEPLAPSDIADSDDSVLPSVSEEIADIDAADSIEDAVVMENAAAYYAATKTFKEITSELMIEYCTDDRDNFKPLPSGIEVANLCGVRISTNNSNFYLNYRSKNKDDGKDWLDYVQSTKSGVYDYAGLPNKPMTNLAIEVYTTSGRRIYDDYVVMYRAKVAGNWLEWVSNGWPDIMRTLKTEYGLSGDLDAQHTDAGWESLGNIQALEIRMFERIEGNTSSSGGSSGTVGDGDFQIASGITMEYYKNRTWYPLTANVSVDSMDGVRLQTNGKPYYLWYRSRDASHGWLSFVSSDDSGVYDYAGWPEFPMSNLEIRVYTQGGTRIFDDYVVMYRAKVSGRGWLDWVSNGNPSVMEAIKTQFGLLGGLDTAATEAGWAASDKIEALDIRVYERKGMNPTPSKNAVLIDAPYINQFDENLPNSCESTSTVMALQYAVGADKISLSSFISNYLDYTASVPSLSTGYGPDPNEVYMGNPFPGNNAYSWGCFSPVIMKAVGKLKNVIGVKATDVSGTSLNSLCTSYIDKNKPVIMWATVGMTSAYKEHQWKTYDGSKSISYNNKLHCLLLIGYDENNYYFNDPMAKKMQGYSKASVEKAYAALGKQAIVITKETSGSGSSGGQTVAPPKDTTVKDSVEIPKTPALKDEYHADPIDLSTGAHVIDHTLMTVSGAQTLNFGISYRSNVLTEGSVGKGWSHNFEKKIEDDGDTVYVYDNPAYYAIYKKSASDSGVYTTDTVTKVNYTLTKIDDGYTINCNYGSTEYYNSVGQLTKITGKTGLNTLITYPNDSTVRITDEISGRYIQLAKNSDGKITSVTDNTGRTCTLGYIDGSLVSITDENGEILSYQYNEKGQIERGRDQNGIIYFTDTYDSAGRVISQKDAIDDSAETIIRYDETTDPDYLLVSVTDRTQQTTVYKYNDKKQLVSKTDPNGVNARYAYDSHGNLTRKSNGLGSVVVNKYDERDNLISICNQRGYTTSYKYDAKNNLIRIKYPGGSYIMETYDYDSNNLLISSTDLRGVTTTYTYNEQNLLTKVSYADRTITYGYTKGQPAAITDPMGRTTTKVYNEAGFLMSVTDAQNNTTSYTYDNKGNVLTVTDAEGNVTAKEYDAGGNLIKSADAKGNITAYTYNGNLKMTSMTLPNGKTIRYAYDGEDRLVKTTYPDGTTAENTYDAGGRMISQTDRDGNTTAYVYDAANIVKKIINPEGGVIQKEHDSEGNLTKIKEPLTIYNPQYDFDCPEFFDENTMGPAMTNVTAITSYTYDINGRVIKSVNPQGGETFYTYNAAGDLLTVTDPMGNKTINTYDSLGNLITVTDPRGNKTKYTYDKAGNLLTVKNALNQYTKNTYDSLNRLVSTMDYGRHVVSYEYDALGRMTSRTDARGNTVTQEYDALGNIVKITNADGHVDYQAVYDSMSNATQVTNAAGSQTTNAYDWAGNLIKETDAKGNSATYTYNGAGQMISAVDKAGGISYATYDGMGNLTSMTGPGGNEKAYDYDSTGRMFRHGSIGADRKGNYYYNAAGLLETALSAWYYFETKYTYDKAGRITVSEDGAGTKTYTYDENGNVIAASDATGTVRREYDALNRVTKYTDVYGQTILYEYDCCGNLCKMTYPTGEAAVYTYDANHNMLSSGVEGETHTTTYEYNAQNQVIKVNNIDGGTVTKSYDSAGRVKTVQDKDKNGKYVVATIYAYDKLGRIISERNPIAFKEYRMTYDDLGRLTSRRELDTKTKENLHIETYTYDAAGNILTAILPDGTENTYQYDSDNCISKMNDSSISVRWDGDTIRCMIGGKNVKLTYDERNRLKQIDGDNNEYWYDADNNRINMSYYQTSMQYLYDCSGGRSRLVWTSDHNLNVSSYYYGAEGLLWSRCNGEYQIYHYDYRGSVVAVTDIDGNVTDTLKYDAYGSTIERTGDSALIFGYNGQYGVLTDPNGLLYMRTRFYNPQLKRFMNADIIDGSIADSTSLNLYTFVNGNPISFVDPFGLSAERGNNNKNVINDLHWLFNCSYDYFSSYKNEAERIRATNDAVMKFLISDRFYNASTLKGVAWDMLAGELDMGYFIYMSQHSNFLSVRESTFYDLDSGEEIDFLHMIATLCACNYESTSGAFVTIPSAYAGWAGDLITLAGDVSDRIPENYDIVEFTKELMRTGDCTFPKSDLIGDIDAVLINEYMSTMPIDQAFEAYYASDYKDRYSKFFAKEFGGYIDNVYRSAEHYLSLGLYNYAFRKAFHSNYSNDIISGVAQGFTEYFVYEVGR